VKSAEEILQASDWEVASAFHDGDLSLLQIDLEQRSLSFTVAFSEDYTVANRLTVKGKFSFRDVSFIALSNVEPESRLPVYSNYVFPLNPIIDEMQAKELDATTIEFILRGIYGWQLRWFASGYSYHRLANA
jgi:hypothetical protein